MVNLLNDLRLRDRRHILKDILEHAVPTTLQDVVIIFVTVSGRNKGQLVQETYANKIYSRNVDGRTLSAFQITTRDDWRRCAAGLVTARQQAARLSG